MADAPQAGQGGQRQWTLADADRLVGDAGRALALAARIYDAAAAQASGGAAGRLRQNAWRAAQMQAGERWRWFSQAGQDRFLDEQVFRGKRGGVFIDIGAYDGWTGSNTLFFEINRGWSGLLVEPSPQFAAQARACRRAPLAECAVGGSDGEAQFLNITAGYTQMSGLAKTYDPGLRAQVEADSRFHGEMLTVSLRRLETLLAEHGISDIDYVSLDVEGGEEAVLASFDFARFPVRAWTIENNTQRGAIAQAMGAAGYRLVTHVGVDEIYVKD